MNTTPKFKIDIVTTSEKVFYGILIIVIVLIVGKLLFIDYSHNETLIITVTDKYIKRDNNQDVYMVATDSNETFKITDLFWLWKFNSTDLYNQLEVGKKYKVEVTRS